MLNIQSCSSFDILSFESSQYIYEKILTQISEKGTFNLGLATGKSPKGLYKNLIRLLSASPLDLSHLHTVNLDEYYLISPKDKRSFFQEMLRDFWQPLHDGNSSFDLTNGHILNGENEIETECKKYEKLIKDLGGIDLQVLGLGPNGHIGFNEPGSEGDSRTRKIALSIESLNALSQTYGDVPKYGLTMGIGTILEAKEIILLVTGESKRKVFEQWKKMTEPDPQIPASWLLLHPKTRIITDLK